MKTRVAKHLSLLVVLLSTFLQAKEPPVVEYAKPYNIDILYLNRAPFAFTNEDGKLSGIEIEILEAFSIWLASEKNVSVKYSYKPYTEFETLYKTIVSTNISSIAAGTITIKPERLEEANLSSPYLRNVSVLITPENVPAAKNFDELYTSLKGYSAITTKGSVHSKYVNSLKQSTLNNLEVTEVNDQMLIPGLIAKQDSAFAYVDLYNYWKYIKSNPEKFIRVQRVANISSENFGFAFSKKSKLSKYFDEFLLDGFGFTSTITYYHILEKYLGPEIISALKAQDL